MDSQDHAVNNATASSTPRASEHTDESTPLLARDTDTEQQYNATNNSQPNGNPQQRAVASSLRRSIESYIPIKRPLLKRWPSILALCVLIIVIVVILIAAFVAPEVVEEYSMQAATFEPTKFSVESFSDDGVMARIQGDFMMDASKVEKKSVRDFGRAATYIAKLVETKRTKVDVTLPEYGGVVLGTAHIPPLVVNVRNQYLTQLDVVSRLEPGPKDGLRRLAKDWIDSRIGDLRVKAEADINLRAGIFDFGTQTLSHSLVFQGNDIPSLPSHNITHVSVHEKSLPDDETGLEAEATLKIKNPYSVDLRIPPLGFYIAAPNCKESQPHLTIADALTKPIHVKPKQDVEVKVSGFTNQFPPEFVKACPQSTLSPLDAMVETYINGTNTTIYVQGSKLPTKDTPEWLTDLISGFTLPVEVEGRGMDDLIKEFTMTDVHFNLPDFFAKPGTPEAQPKVTATIIALVGVPDEIKFPIDVPRVKGLADIYYDGDKFGYLDLRKWREATSKPVEDSNSSDIEVESKIQRAPIQITDNDVFARVVSELVTGDETIHLDVKANVSVELDTALGVFKVRNIHAEGDVPVEPLGGGDFKDFSPRIGNLKISRTAEETLVIDALMNITNPTVYSATVPFVDLKISVNDTILGHATAENVIVERGNNTNLPVRAVYSPLDESCEEGVEVGREFLSQYLSGFNTTLKIHTHEGSLPSQPEIGKRLSSLKIEIPTPQIGSPGDPDDGDDEDPPPGEGAPNFIKKATMHLFTSTASFTIISPLEGTTMYITYLNATASHHNETVGTIFYDGLIEVPPGASETPILPVEWCLSCVGYEDIKKALGGSLKLSASATVGVRIGQFEERIWFVGRGIGVNVRI